jgi:hypothetical protein
MSEKKILLGFLILAVAIVVGAFVNGGLYEISDWATPAPRIVRINRLTGAITIMEPSQYRVTQWTLTPLQ